MLRIPHCVDSARERRDVHPREASERPKSVDTLSGFFSTDYFSMPILKKPALFINAITGSGVCTIVQTVV